MPWPNNYPVINLTDPGQMFSAENIAAKNAKIVKDYNAKNNTSFTTIDEIKQFEREKYLKEHPVTYNITPPMSGGGFNMIGQQLVNRALAEDAADSSVGPLTDKKHKQNYWNYATKPGIQLTAGLSAIPFLPEFGSALVTAPITTGLSLLGGMGLGYAGAQGGRAIDNYLGNGTDVFETLGGLGGMFAGGPATGRYILPNVMPGRFAGEAMNTLGAKFMEASGKNPQLWNVKNWWNNANMLSNEASAMLKANPNLTANGIINGAYNWFLNQNAANGAAQTATTPLMLNGAGTTSALPATTPQTALPAVAPRLALPAAASQLTMPSIARSFNLPQITLPETNLPEIRTVDSNSSVAELASRVGPLIEAINATLPPDRWRPRFDDIVPTSRPVNQSASILSETPEEINNLTNPNFRRDIIYNTRLAPETLRGLNLTTDAPNIVVTPDINPINSRITPEETSNLTTDIQTENVHELPPPPSEVNIDLGEASWTPSTWTPITVPSGLSRVTPYLRGFYDIQGLMKRGYTPEQLELNVIDGDTGRIGGYRRNNILWDRLHNGAGVLPEGPDRLDFLRTALNEGQSVYHAPSIVNIPEGVTLPRTIGYGAPITESEIQNAMNEGIVPSDFDISTLRPATSRSIEEYYTRGINRAPSASPVTPRPTVELDESDFTPFTIPEEPAVTPYEQDTKFRDALRDFSDKINERFSSMSEEDQIRMYPIIKNAVDEVWQNYQTDGKTWEPDQIWNKLNQSFTNAYSSAGKSFTLGYSPAGRFPSRASASFFKGNRVFPNSDRMLQQILSGNAPEESHRGIIRNPYISSEPYTDETLPLSWDLMKPWRDDVGTVERPFNADGVSYPGSYSHFMVFTNEPSTFSVNPGDMYHRHTGEIVSKADVSSIPSEKLNLYETIPEIENPEEQTSAIERAQQSIALRDMSYRRRQMYDALHTIPHGGMVFEGNKSLQSLPLQHDMVLKEARRGRGKIIFDGLTDINRTNNKYRYIETNTCAGTAIHPQYGHADKISSIVNQNVTAFNDLLRATDPKIFEAFGGKPDLYGTFRIVRNETTEPLFTHPDFQKATRVSENEYRFLLKDISQEWLNLFDAAVEATPQSARRSTFDLNIIYPMSGFRSFKKGGILKRI